MSSYVKSGSALVKIIHSFQVVFRRRFYVLLALVVAVLVLLAVMWMPNWLFFRYLTAFPSLTLAEKISIWFQLGWSLVTNKTLLVILALLSGIDVALLVYHLRQRLKLLGSASMGALGIVSGLVGIGCASCGSIILSSVFGLGVTLAFLEFLPLRGAEFSILSISVLLLSIVITARGISSAHACGRG